MNYKIIFASSVKKDFKKIAREYQTRLMQAIQNLAENPFPDTNWKKLKGSDHCFRLRVGDYRILYETEECLKIVSVYKVGHRKDVYE